MFNLVSRILKLGLQYDAVCCHKSNLDKSQHQSNMYGIDMLSLCSEERVCCPCRIPHVPVSLYLARCTRSPTVVIATEQHKHCSAGIL